jgi:regulator of protease activity HflC (stomatin/prohibitin superfamily)
MKKVTIATNFIALVSKQGVLKRVLSAGSHWLGFGESIEVHDMSKPFLLKTDIDALLQHIDLANALIVVEVMDNELVLVYQNQNFKNVLSAGRHIFWKGLNPYTFITTNISNIEIDPSIDRNLFDKAALSAHIRNFRLEPHEKGLMLVDDILERELNSGNYYWWKNNRIIHVIKTDIRQLSCEILGQEILTKDKAQLRVNFNFQYKVVDIYKALIENKEFEKQLYQLMQFGLREFIAKLSLDELMESKNQISEAVLMQNHEKAKEFGVQLINCGIKDIILPGDIKDIMNQVLIAEKRAQANLITRREETASTRSLLNTAKLMEDNAMLYKLKEMEYVEKIAEKINNISLSGGGQIVDQLKQIFVKQ